MKKNIFAIFIFSLFSGSLCGQMVYTDPAVPTNGRVIKIYYDSSKDNGDLKNYTGDIYVHTGVTVNGAAWQKVIGTWGLNTTQPKLKYLGNYLYELDITPDIYTFYSVPLTDAITKICLVFRNAGADKQTRPDIFLDVYKVSLNATFTLPEKTSIVTELNKKIIIKASALLADSLSLYINNVWIKHGKTSELVTDTLVADQYGEFTVKAVAWDYPLFVSDSFFFYVRKPVVTEALPAGLKDGINYTGSSSVTLVLHAPYKEYAFATGDFTNWHASEKGYMKKTPDNERYWVEIAGLKPGKEYRFQYLVDSVLYIADPYADKVLDPSNDPYITSATYPGLIQYPTDSASGIVSVLQTAQVPYSWQTTGYQPPQKSKLTIYELLVRDFVAKHDFKTLTDTLGYLDELGINAIELMPVCEFDGNISWGYNPSFYFAPDKYYGPKNDMKAFVDSCHNRGIAVIMDIVLNHTNGKSPFVQLYVDHFGSDQIYMKLPNPWFNASSPNPIYKWDADFNHESVSTQNLVDRICAYWLTEYNIDGFRFDFTSGFTNTPGDGSAYDASRIAILKRIADRIWEVKPDAYIILEHFTNSTEQKELADYGMMLWGNNNYNYAEAAMGYSSDLTYASYTARGWNNPNLVSYMESHDEERLMYKTLNFGAVTGDYITKNQRIALKRMQLDALFFLTIPGPKMIWQFGELGYDISIEQNGRTGEKPIKWEYLSDPDRHRLFATYKLLNNLRKTQPVFSTSGYSATLSTAMKRIQLVDPSMTAIMLGNFGITPSTINPSFTRTGKWYEYFSGDSITITNVEGNFNFQPGEFRLYTTVRLPSAKLILGINDQPLQEKNDFITAYPNPSRTEFYFGIESAGQEPVTISIFDITGRMVRQIKTETSGDLSEPIIWDGRSSAGVDTGKGLYIVQIHTTHQRGSIKIIKE
jgi:glycosidase